MSSIAHTDGFYYVPRIDKKIIENHKDNLIVYLEILMEKYHQKF